MQQKYLILKGNAGLGNRIYSLCHAIEYAKKNNRILIIDWADGLYFEPGKNFFSDYFHLADVAYQCADRDFYESLKSERPTAYPPWFTGRLDAPIHEGFVKVSNGLMLRAGHRFSDKTKLKGYWLEIKYFKGDPTLGVFPFLFHACRKNSLYLGANLVSPISEDVVIFADYTPPFNEQAFRRYFRLNDSFTRAASVLGDAIDISKCIGVHVRATDLLPTKPVTSIVDHIREKHPGEPVFLATDSKDVVSLFQASFDDLRLQQKEISDSSVGIHQASAHSQDYSNARSNFESGLNDMYLLSRCKILYTQGNSSFSRISGAMRNDRPINWLKL